MTSVFEKALEMKAEAARLRQGAQAEEDARRVSNRVDETMGLLQQAGVIADAGKRLHAACGAPPPDTTDLRNARNWFARRAAGGPPDNRSFTLTQEKIKAATKRLKDDLSGAWNQWATPAVKALPLVRIALLPAEQQQAARTERDALYALAKKTLPTAADVGRFETSSAQLRQLLDSVAEPPQELLALLHRLGERPPLTLQDLSDGQIAQLRDAGVAGQIELHREGM